MKRILTTAFICITVLALAIVILVACSTAAQKNDETLLDGTLSSTEHLSPDTNGEDVIFPDPEGTEHTEEKTEPSTEKETEDQTEKETETEPEPEEKNLKFTSYGNGTCAVSGLGSYTDVYLIIPEKSPEGDVVISIDEKAFYGNTEIIAVFIPSTVMSIEDKAFGACTSLIYVLVDEKNKSFCDIEGVLYTKDGLKLILFPSANQSSEITISKNVQEICDMAFYSAPNLNKINYTGTLEDWSKIKIGEKNNGLYSAAISFATAN